MNKDFKKSLNEYINMRSALRVAFTSMPKRLTMMEALILFKVWENKSISIKQILQERENLRKMTVYEKSKLKVRLTQIIKNLIEQGILKKEINPSDKRSKIISLTNDGQKFLKDVLWKTQKVWEENHVKT